jgi:DNA polymerase I-like protein with 3'-5' exonuclease and polymerase domains
MAEEANKKLKKLRKTEEDFNHKSFNPGSTKEMRILLYEHLGLPVTSQTKTGLPATDARTLNTLIHTLRKNP